METYTIRDLPRVGEREAYFEQTPMMRALWEQNIIPWGAEGVNRAAAALSQVTTEDLKRLPKAVLDGIVAQLQQAQSFDPNFPITDPMNQPAARATTTIVGENAMLPTAAPAGALGANVLRRTPDPNRTVTPYADPGPPSWNQAEDSKQAQAQAKAIEEQLAASEPTAPPFMPGRARHDVTDMQRELLKESKKRGSTLEYDPEQAPPPYIVPATPIRQERQVSAIYPGKKYTPQEEQIQKAAAKAQKTINTGNYPRFFDISKRKKVDPRPYGLPNQRTSTVPQHRAKKQKTIDAWKAKTSAKEPVDRLKRAYAIGLKMKETQDWYYVKQIEDAFIKEFGKKEGRIRFKERFADAMAATTAGNDPTGNLRMAALANFYKQQGIPLPEEGWQVPYPTVGRYGTGGLEEHAKRTTTGFVPEENPKKYNFSGNFLGREDATIDEQMLWLFDPAGPSSPPAGRYGYYEDTIQGLADDLGIPASNFQDVAWSGGKLWKDAIDASKKGPLKGKKPEKIIDMWLEEGGKNATAKPMIEIFNEMLYRTSQVHGISQEEALKGFIHADTAMYSKGAGVPLTGAKAPQSEDTQLQRILRGEDYL